MTDRQIDLVAIQQMRSRVHKTKTSMRTLPVALLMCGLPALRVSAADGRKMGPLARATHTTRPMMLGLLAACMLSTASAQSGACTVNCFGYTCDYWEEGNIPGICDYGGYIPGGYGGYIPGSDLGYSCDCSGCACDAPVTPSPSMSADDDEGTCECFANKLFSFMFTLIFGLADAGVVYFLMIMIWVMPTLRALYKNEGEEVEAMVVNKKTWTTTSTPNKDGQTSTTTHYRMTVKYVVANGDTVTKELIPSAKQYSNHFEGNNATMIYLRPPHDPRTAILKDQLTVTCMSYCLMITGLIFCGAICAGVSSFMKGDPFGVNEFVAVGINVCPCVFIWTVPLAILLGGWMALRTQKIAIAPEGQIQKAGSIPDPVTVEAELVAVNKGTEPPKGSKFDPTTGAPIPKFDPETGKQNW